MSGSTVYLCEKPDQARNIAKAMGGAKAKDGYIEAANNTVITWAFGHLFTLKMPEDYDENLKRWNWDTLPIIPKPFQFKPTGPSVSKQIKIISGLLKGAGEVVVATDADREGEFIAYEILTELRYKGPTKRLWLSDLTLPAIKKALANLLPGDKTKPLYYAALARSCADWFVGINLTRAATMRLRKGPGKPLSIGRVQTPTLALMVRVERKIRNFKPEDYFELVADVQTAGGHALKMRFAPKPEKRIVDRAKIQALASQAQGAKGPIAAKTESKTSGPPALFELNTLQQACNARFGWSADHTLKVLQSCYETHKVLTYSRTDSTYLPDEHRQNIPTIMTNLLSLSEFSHLAPKLASPIERKTVYDTSKITAHHAIAPTLDKPDLSALSADEKKLYMLVARHYLAAHMEDYRFNSTSISFDANGVPFIARGTQPTYAGWREAFGMPGGEDSADIDDDKGDEGENSVLPPVKDGEGAIAAKVDVEAKKTQPPKRFTEKTLLQAMKNVASYVDDEAAKKRLKETSGIGTPATRANIIETLKQRGFIEVKKRQLIPTDTGMSLIEAIESAIPSYADPAQTAAWEDVLEMIADGKVPTEKLVDAIILKVSKDVQTLRERTDLVTIAGGENTSDRGTGSKTAPRSGGGGKVAGGTGIDPEERKKRLAAGTVLTVNYDDRDKAKGLKAAWDSERKKWVAPAGVDLEPFRQAEFL